MDGGAWVAEAVGWAGGRAGDEAGVCVGTGIDDESTADDCLGAAGCPEAEVANEPRAADEPWAADEPGAADELGTGDAIGVDAVSMIGLTVSTVDCAVNLGRGAGSAACAPALASDCCDEPTAGIGVQSVSAIHTSVSIRPCSNLAEVQSN